MGDVARHFSLPEREKRVPVDLPAIVHAFGHGAVGAKVRNLSANGFYAECDVALLDGAQVLLEIAALGIVSAQIRWIRGKRIGGLFNGRMTSEQKATLAKLLSRSDLPPLRLAD